MGAVALPPLRVFACLCVEFVSAPETERRSARMTGNVRRRRAREQVSV